MLVHLKQTWSSATRCAPTLGQRSFTTVQASMEKIKQSFTEDAFFRQLERERLERIKLAKPQIDENAPNLMIILEKEGVPVAMHETLKTQLLLWKHEDM
jgi:DNA-binding TFAR19-related protein (PDSD5 family)